MRKNDNNYFLKLKKNNNVILEKSLFLKLGLRVV